MSPPQSQGLSVHKVQLSGDEVAVGRGGDVGVDVGGDVDGVVGAGSWHEVPLHQPVPELIGQLAGIQVHLLNTQSSSLVAAGQLQ